MIFAQTGLGVVGKPVTKSVPEQEAVLLQEMSQCQSRLPDIETDLALLLRLADDPLLVSAILQRRHVVVTTASLSRDCAAAVIVHPVQKGGPFQNDARCRTVRSYCLAEIDAVNSSQPYNFAPSQEDCEMALDGDAQSLPKDTVIIRQPLHLWADFVPVYLVAGLLVVVLLLRGS
jgi:hypothetical protein